MKTKKFIKTLISMSLCACLCAGTVLGAAGCSDDSSAKNSTSSVTQESLVTLNSYTRTVEEGESFTLIATVESGSVVFSSSDTSVATVDATGKVTAVKQGTATITATCGDEYAACIVTVKEKTVIAPTFELGIKTTALYVEGSPIKLTPYVTVDGKELNAEALAQLNIAYASDNTAVVTVSTDGKVTAVAHGNANVKASFTLDGVYFEDSVAVTVQDLILVEPLAEQLTLASPTTLSGAANTKHTTGVVGAKVYRGENLEELTDATFTYESSDENVATVDAQGNVTVVGAGSASVKITYDGITTATRVNVATAIASKADLDKIGTAYKDGNVSLWSEDASYVLVNDIDYQGAEFTPIAALPASYLGATWACSVRSTRTKARVRRSRARSTATAMRLRTP